MTALTPTIAAPTPAAERPHRERFWFPALPLGRIAALRVVGYVFVLLDLVWWTPWTRPHREIDAFYQPLAVGRLLHLPAPAGRVVAGVEVRLTGTALVSLGLASGRGRRVPSAVPRLLGIGVALLYG